MQITIVAEPQSSHISPTRLARLERRELARSARTGRGRLGLVARGGALELLADLLDAGSASGAVDGGGVAEVGVDADEQLSAGGLDVLHHHVALGALLAVAARAVQLAEVGDLEAVDGDGAGAVVLDHLVCGAGGTAAGDGCVAVLLEGQGICVVVSMCEVLRGGISKLTLADAGPPDVLQSARSLAVDALDLVCVMLV